MATIDQRPARLDMYCAEGDDFTATFSVTENGSPWVSTGATVVTGILNRAGTAQVTNFTTAVSTGSLTLTLTDTQTTTLGAGVYRYYVQVTKSGVSRTWVAGGFTVAPDSGTGSSSTSASLSISTGDVTLATTTLVAPTASNISFTPSGSLNATDVQTAITEASTDLDAHLNDTVDAHDASAISVLDTAGLYAATEVEGALAEVMTLQPMRGLALTGSETMPRFGMTSTSVITTSGSLRMAYFTAYSSFTAANVRVLCGNTAAGATPTLIRFGIYSVAGNGDLTLVASTPNDTTLLAATNTMYTKALSTPYAMVAGQRYAVAVLVVTGATAPTVYGFSSTVPTMVALTPKLAAGVGGQTDLPASITDASLSNIGNILWAGLTT